MRLRTRLPTRKATITSTTAGVDGAAATAIYTFGDQTVVGYPTINVTDDDDARARVRDRMWGEHGLLSHGDSRLVVPKPSQRARR